VNSITLLVVLVLAQEAEKRESVGHWNNLIDLNAGIKRSRNNWFCSIANLTFGAVPVFSSSMFNVPLNVTSVTATWVQVLWSVGEMSGNFTVRRDRSPCLSDVFYIFY